MGKNCNLSSFSAFDDESATIHPSRVEVPHEHVVSSMSIRYDPLPSEENGEDIPGKAREPEIRGRHYSDGDGGINQIVLMAVGLVVATAIALFFGYVWQ